MLGRSPVHHPSPSHGLDSHKCHTPNPDNSHLVSAGWDWQWLGLKRNWSKGKRLDWMCEGSWLDKLYNVAGHWSTVETHSARRQSYFQWPWQCHFKANCRYFLLHGRQPKWWTATNICWLPPQYTVRLVLETILLVNLQFPMPVWPSSWKAYCQQEEETRVPLIATQMLHMATCLSAIPVDLHVTFRAEVLFGAVPSEWCSTRCEQRRLDVLEIVSLVQLGILLHC